MNGGVEQLRDRVVASLPPVDAAPSLLPVDEVIIIVAGPKRGVPFVELSGPKRRVVLNKASASFAESCVS